MEHVISSIRSYKSAILIAILVIFYTVGTVGLLLPEHKEKFLSLSFFNLMLSFTVMFLGRKTQIQKFIAFLVLCFAVGMTVEWIGTKTGLLFGEYWYGKNLGIKLAGVPLVIGLNWGILVVCSASLVGRLKWPLYFKVILAALLMTGLDFLMEPVAMRSDYWNWKNDVIPIYNYVCWFFISIPLHWIYFKFELVEVNKVFDTLFLLLIVFFGLLNLL